MNEASGRSGEDSIITNADPHGEAEGISLVARYSASSARRSEAQRGPFPRYISIEDVIQDVHVLLCESMGEDYLIQLGRASGPDFKRTDEYIALRVATQLAIDRSRGTEDKRRQRRLPQMEALSGELVLSRDNREQIDQALSFKQALDRLSPRERRVLILRREGYRNTEIARILGLTEQQASAMARGAINKIALALDKPGGS